MFTHYLLDPDHTTKKKWETHPLFLDSTEFKNLDPKLQEEAMCQSYRTLGEYTYKDDKDQESWLISIVREVLATPCPKMKCHTFKFAHSQEASKENSKILKAHY